MPKPDPSVRDTARKVDRVMLVLERRQATLRRAVAIVRAVKGLKRKSDV